MKTKMFVMIVVMLIGSVNVMGYEVFFAATSGTNSIDELASQAGNTSSLYTTMGGFTVDGEPLEDVWAIIFSEVDGQLILNGYGFSWGGDNFEFVIYGDSTNPYVEATMIIPIINDGNPALVGVETYVDPADGLTKNRILIGSDIGGDDIVFPQSSLSIDGGAFGDISTIVYDNSWVSLVSVELVTPPIMLASPKHLAINVDPNNPLEWDGTEGVTYVVNFWETQDPNAPAYAIETMEESINVKEYLKWNTVYSWQVHEVTTGTITFSTPIWHFWTDEYKCAEELIGDLNGDCSVDLADFALLAGNWLVDVPKVPKSS